MPEYFRLLKHVQEADTGIAQEIEKRQEPKCGASSVGTIDSYQRVPDRSRSPSDDRHSTVCIAGGGQRSTSNEKSFEPPETARSECDHVCRHFLAARTISTRGSPSVTSVCTSVDRGDRIVAAASAVS